MSNGKAASAGAVATSDDLVAAFKASGAFDDLRAELLKSFMRDVGCYSTDSEPVRLLTGQSVNRNLEMHSSTVYRQKSKRN